MIRLSFDGLPRDLRLSRQERRELVRRINRLPVGEYPRWAPFVPGGMMLAGMLVWFPAVHLLPDPSRYATVGLVVFGQGVLSVWLMVRTLWPYRCRQMAMAGYEVCPRCAYPQLDAAPEVPVCAECGADRIIISP